MKKELMKQGDLKVDVNNQLFCKSRAKGWKDEHGKNKPYKNDVFMLSTVVGSVAAGPSWELMFGNRHLLESTDPNDAVLH